MLAGAPPISVDRRSTGLVRYPRCADQVRGAYWKLVERGRVAGFGEDWDAQLTAARTKDDFASDVCSGSDSDNCGAGRQRDIATQRLEERLNAATSQAAHPAVDDLHVADAHGRCDLSRWGAGDERHLDSSAQELICHDSQVAPGATAESSSNVAAATRACDGVAAGPVH